MEFTDKVPEKACGVVVRGVAEVYRFGGDMRLGAIVINALAEMGYETRGITMENLGQHFRIVSATDKKIIVEPNS